MKRNISTFLLLLIFTLIVFLPILINPSLVLNRGNDLEEFFWPIVNFIKIQIKENHVLPLWNNLFLSGTPLLPDPQSMLFYPLNTFFLIFSIDKAFIFLFFIHTLLGGVGAYLCSRKALNFSRSASLFTAFLFISSPKVFGYLEAGHYGLVNSIAFFPFVLLATIQTVKEFKIIWPIVLALSLAAIFNLHSLTFVISALASSIVFIVNYFTYKERNKKSFIYYFLGAILTFGLIAVNFLPQIEWSKETTRYLLVVNKDVYPKWTSKLEVIKTILVPWKASNYTNSLPDSEKWIAVGLIPTAFALFGFLKLKRKFQVIIALVVGGIFLLIMNNASPIYGFLLEQKWFLLLRVSTRFWFIVTVLVSFLGGFTYDKFSKGKSKIGFLTFLAFLCLIEPIALSWTYLARPVQVKTDITPEEVYEFLKEDKSRFRVFCTTRCLSQKKASIAQLELADGYSTLPQKNYYQQAWQWTGTYWNYYTLSIPPIGVYKFTKIQPEAQSLGKLNVKYVVSPHLLTDKNFKLIEKIGNYYIYLNSLVLPRAFFITNDKQGFFETPILSYSPNNIKVDTSSHKSSIVVLSEVYSPGWNAYLNGKTKVPVLERPDVLRLVNMNTDTDFINFKYEPKSFLTGEVVTIITTAGILLYTIFFFAASSKRQGRFPKTKTEKHKFPTFLPKY